MALNLLKNLISYVFSNDTDKLHEEKPLKYICAGNGLAEQRMNPLLTVTRKIDSIPKLPEIEEGVILNTPKLPFAIFNRIVAFMKFIYEKDSTESTIMVFYNKEQNMFKLWAPLQENSAALSKYQRDDDPEYTRMCQENILVMVAHSHPWGTGGMSTTSPSPSGTDNNDEKEAILYMIVGNVKGIPTTYVSTCPGGVRMKLKFFDIFQNPLVSAASNPKLDGLLAKYVPEYEIFQSFATVEGIEVPAEWIGRCKKDVVTYTNYWKDSSTRGYRSEDDPEVQYHERYATNYYGRYYDGYDNSDEDYFDDAYGYGNHNNKTCEKKPSKEYDEKTLEEHGMHVEETSEDDGPMYDLDDAIDAALELSDVELGQLIFTLIKEGKAGLIHACMKIDEAVPKEKEGVGVKAGIKLLPTGITLNKENTTGNGK